MSVPRWIVLGYLFASAINRLGRRFDSALVSIAIAAVFAWVVFPTSHARAQVFTDFTTVDTTNNIASGSIGPVAVFFSGTGISFGVTDNTFTGFNSTFFAPPLPTSDVVEFFDTNSTTSAFTITFGSPLTDPRLHLKSLASTLDFGTIPLTKLSGQEDFLVSGSTVIGAYGPTPPTDANGTVQLNGTFTSISFTVTTVAGVTSDGITLQIGVVPYLPGDYNDDGSVDAADYVVWRKNDGTSNTLPNDGGLPGPIDEDHYNLWQTNFGQLSGSGSLSNAGVPEPTTLVLLMFAAIGWCLRRGRAAS